MNTTITFAGNLAGDPQLEHIPEGKHGAILRVLVNRLRLIEAGDGVDGEPTGHDARVFATAVTQARAPLRRGERWGGA